MYTVAHACVLLYRRLAVLAGPALCLFRGRVSVCAIVVGCGAFVLSFSARFRDGIIEMAVRPIPSTTTSFLLNLCADMFARAFWQRLQRRCETTAQNITSGWSGGQSSFSGSRQRTAANCYWSNASRHSLFCCHFISAFRESRHSPRADACRLAMDRSSKLLVSHPLREPPIHDAVHGIHHSRLPASSPRRAAGSERITTY